MSKAWSRGADDGGWLMMRIRKAEDRGRTDLNWLKSDHTFSFGGYYDPEHMGFESLLVINDDRVAPGGGFGTHPHNNMEIISYVLDGAMEHKDSMGNGSVIRPGEVQRMSAGTGITHSEYNHSKEQEVHFLQIWFFPDEQGLEPCYDQKAFSDTEKRGTFRLVTSKTGRDGSVSLHQDMDMSVALVDRDEKAIFETSKDRTQWVHIAKGEVMMNGHSLKAGDGVALADETALTFDQGDDAEVIVFDMRRLTRRNSR